MAKTPPVDTIGNIELINLPKLALADIPAKIDTGAESSSIWASSIELKDGILEFKLFAPGSAYYSGKTIKTKTFQTAIIRNSFGTKEFRYKVEFLVQIGSRKIRTLFTLADRSGMGYPVLLGRNTLRNKFIVDVSRHKVHGGSRKIRKILILTKDPADFVNFFENVGKKAKSNIEFTVRDYKDLAFFIKPGKVQVIDTISNKDICKYEVVYLKSHFNSYPLAISAAQYLQFKGVKFFDKEISTHIAYDKLSAYTKLAIYNIPVPITICASNEYLQNNIAKLGTQLGWPLVCKEINSDRGRKNYLLKNNSAVKKALQEGDPKDIYILQEYIPNNGWVRGLIFHHSEDLFIGRSAVDHKDSRRQHLNSPIGSANAYLIKADEIDPTARDLAVRSSDIMNRQIAGVDLIKNKATDRWVVVEVNNSPQVKSGAFVEEKEKAFANFIDTELNR